jgi:hypothetical protein
MGTEGGPLLGATTFLDALGRWSPAVRLRTRSPSGALNAGPLLLASPDRPFFLLLDARAEGGAALSATRPHAFEMLAPAWDELRRLEPDAALRRVGQLIQSGNQAGRGARVYASAACWAPGNGADGWKVAEAGETRCFVVGPATPLTAGPPPGPGRLGQSQPSVRAAGAALPPGRALVVLTQGALVALGGPEVWAADPVGAFDACTGWREQDAALVRFEPAAAREGRA